ncbi:MAG: T9SS type A sorting domain-containing protein [Flavobacteriales bacterium]|nr:T9SS type A sorting domain-containing protein [Flavobacteriales bacterium]
MKKRIIFYLILVALVTGKVVAQPAIPNTTVIIKNNRSYSSPATSKNYETKKKSFYRNVQFDATLGTTCIYDHGNANDQNRWNKFLKLTTKQNSQTLNSIRLGWRYNLAEEAFEYGYYAHMNHEDPAYGGETGREAYAFNNGELFSVNRFYQPSETAHIEMMFSKKGYTVKIDGEALHVYRDVVSWDPDNGEKTKLRVSAYFGTSINFFGISAPQKMFLNASNIVLDDSNYAINSNERCATNHYFMNSIFNFGETLTYYATDDIFVPVAMDSNNSSDKLIDSHSDPNGVVIPFFEVESGSTVHLWAGGDVLWQSGFSCLGGAEMHCISGVTTACLPCNPNASCKMEAPAQEETAEILALFGVPDTIASEEPANEYIEPDYEEEAAKPLPYFDENVYVYPNPSTGSFHVDIINFSEVVNIEIVDATGRVVQTIKNHSSHHLDLDLNKAGRGVYFIRITDNNKTGVSRIVVK